MNTGLNLNSTTHYNQWLGINALNLKPTSAGAVALRPVFATRVALLTTDLGLLAPVVGRANADVTGITGLKEGAKKTAADTYGVITSNALSFAIQYNMTDLQTQMQNATASYILATKDSNFAGVCGNLNTLLAAVIVANPVTAIEYFTTAQLTAAAATVPLFTAKLGVYRAAIADVESAKREFRAIWMPKMKAHILFLTNMLAGAITMSFPAYAGAFVLLLKLVNVGKRDQGVFANVVDDVTGLPFANIATIAPTNYPPIRVPKLGKSDGSGDFKTLRLKVGLWRIKVSVPGFVDQFIMVQVTAKEVIRIVVRMRAV